MKAIVLYEHGGPEKLIYETDFPEPSVGPGEVLIKVKATGVNRVDLVVRSGYPGITVSMPHIPGGDIAGTVAQLGGNVRGFSLGERVVTWPLIACGTCALPILHEGMQPALGGTVVRLLRATDPRGDRTDRDDASAAPLVDHHARRLLAARKMPAQVHRMHPVEQFHRHVQKVLHRTDTRVAHEDIQTAELCNRPCNVSPGNMGH